MVEPKPQTGLAQWCQGSGVCSGFVVPVCQSWKQQSCDPHSRCGSGKFSSSKFCDKECIACLSTAIINSIFCLYHWNLFPTFCFLPYHKKTPTGCNGFLPTAHLHLYLQTFGTRYWALLYVLTACWSDLLLREQETEWGWPKFYFHFRNQLGSESRLLEWQ